MKTIQTEVPEQLYKKAQTLVREGWFRDGKDIFSEAIRRFLASRYKREKGPQHVLLFSGAKRAVLTVL